MKAFLEFAVGQLIDFPETMVLREDSQDGLHAFQLELPPSEVGKVIGKGGHTIRALRNLLGAAAARHGGRATFEIVERPGARVE